MVNNSDICCLDEQTDPRVAVCPVECNKMAVIQASFLFQSAMNVEHEVNLLVEEIHRLGSKSKYS